MGPWYRLIRLQAVLSTYGKLGGKDMGLGVGARPEEGWCKEHDYPTYRKVCRKLDRIDHPCLIVS